jgi:large subunit ribosomal protein L31
MKKGVHPNYHFVNVVLNDGTSYKTRTTWASRIKSLRSTSTRPRTQPGPAVSSS